MKSGLDYENWVRWRIKLISKIRYSLDILHLAIFYHKLSIKSIKILNFFANNNVERAIDVKQSYVFSVIRFAHFVIKLCTEMANLFKQKTQKIDMKSVLNYFHSNGATNKIEKCLIERDWK